MHTRRQSEPLLRLLVGLALGFGFVGFATQQHAQQGVAGAFTASVASVVPTAAR